jgi:hypothetical protein
VIDALIHSGDSGKRDAPFITSAVADSVDPVVEELVLPGKG